MTLTPQKMSEIHERVEASREMLAAADVSASIAMHDRQALHDLLKETEQACIEQEKNPQLLIACAIAHMLGTPWSDCDEHQQKMAASIGNTIYRGIEKELGRREREASPIIRVGA